MVQLKVGVIGVGHLGQHHARIYSTLSDATLIGVCDRDEERGQSIAEQYHAKYFSDINQLLSEVDAVSVAVPTSSHFSVVKACLNADVHVLVEKPITSQIDEGQCLVELSDERHCLLQVGHVERFNPIVDLVRPLIRNPGFLECHRLSPFQPRGTDVDVVLDLMIHDLDMVLSLDLGPVVKVEASGLAVLTEQVDIANARIVFGHGGVATFTASRISTGRLRKCRVFQPDAYISLDYQDRRAIVHRRMNPGGIVETEQLCGTEDEPLQRELLSFIGAVRSQTCPHVTGAEGVASLELAHRILAQIQAGSMPNSSSH